MGRRGGACGLLLIMLGCGSSGEPPLPTRLARSTAAIVEGDTFVAYFGAANFDLQLAREEGAALQFDAVQGPLTALRDETIVIDLAEGGPWTVMHNLSYTGGDDGLQPLWTLLRFSAGVPGLSGSLAVRGIAETPGEVEAQYDARFSGMYALPNIGKDEVKLTVSFANSGPMTAEFGE